MRGTFYIAHLDLQRFLGNFLQSSHVISVIILTGATRSRYNDNDHPSTLFRLHARSFLFPRAGFCGVPFAPSDVSVMNESWRISRMAGVKKISQPMHRNYSKTMTSWGWEGSSREKKRQHERSRGGRREESADDVGISND